MSKRDVPRRIDIDPAIFVTAAGVVVMPSVIGSYLMSDGSVALTGDMDVLAGVTIDGVDISELGETVEQLAGANTAPTTGYTVMSHGSNLADSLPDWGAELKVWADIFATNEQVAVSNTAGQIELMRVTGPAVADTNIDGAACWNYPVTRRVTTNPPGLNVGWAKGTLANGLTFRGYVAFDNRGGSSGSPSMRIVQWLDNPPTNTEHILRTGSLSGVLGLGENDFGFAAGRLTTADQYLLFNAAQGRLALRNADLEVLNEAGERVIWMQGSAPGGNNATGYTMIGPQTGGHFTVDPAQNRVSIWIGDQEIIYFDAEDGSRISGLLAIGNPTGPQIQLGKLGGDAVIVARNAFDVAGFVVRAQTAGVYLFAGNPKPQGHWLEFDQGIFTVDGTVRARAMEIIGQTTVSDTGEIIVRDPADPRRYGHIKPHYLAGYSVDSTDTQYLSTLIAWAPAVLEAQPGSGQWRTWIAGEAFFGDWRYGHFRIERNGRVGLFNGETPKVYLDSSGNAVVTGSIVWAGGQGIADDDGIRVEAREFGDPLSTRNRYRLVTKTGEAISYLEGFYSSSYASSIFSVDSHQADRDTVISVNAVSKATKTVEANMTAMQVEKQAYFRATIDAAGVSRAKVSADQIQIGDGGIANYMQFGADGSLVAYGVATATFVNGIIGPSWKPSADSTTALQLQDSSGAPFANLDTSNGWMALGGGAPAAQLDVYAESSAWSQARGLTVGQHYNGTGAALINFKRSRGSHSSPLTVANGDNVGVFWTGVHDGTSYVNSAAFGFTVNGTVTTGSVPVDLIFSAGSAHVTNFKTPERMRITSQGLVGIGTTAPATNLHVQLTDSLTDTVGGILTLGHNTSGTPTTLFGSRMSWKLKSDTTEDQIAAYLDVLWADAAHATRSSATKLYTVYGGTAVEVAKFGGTVGNVFNEEGTSWCDFRVEGDTSSNLFFVDASADMVGVGTGAPATRLHVQQTSGDTSAIRNLVTIGHNSTGTSAAGFGAGLLFTLKDTTTNDQNAGLIEALWNTATHGGTIADLVLSAYDTAKREGIRVRGAGSAAAIGLYGATPVVQATTGITDATFVEVDGTTITDKCTFDGYTIQQIVKALRSLGALA